MTTPKTINKKNISQVIPGFSVLKMKEEIQAKIYSETKNMTNEEIREYFRVGSEIFYNKHT